MHRKEKEKNGQHRRISKEAFERNVSISQSINDLNEDRGSLGCERFRGTRLRERKSLA